MLFPRHENTFMQHAKETIKGSRHIIELAYWFRRKAVKSWALGMG